MFNYNVIIEKEGGQKVFWDFGVTKENEQVQEMNRLLEQTITEKNILFLITVMLMGKNLNLLWNLWQYIINGMRGICLRMWLRRKNIGRLRLQECKTYK